MSNSFENNYLDLLNSIGIPGIIAGSGISHNQELMQIAMLNKVQLLYAHNTAVKINDLMDKHQQTIDTILEVANLFNINNINYAVFKTIKPFFSTPSDVDILVPEEHLLKAKILLSTQGYRAFAKDICCITMQKEMNVDLYLHPSVANLPYLNREILINYKQLTNLHGSRVSTLSNEAEFVAIACHSFYKEQILTLNDFITLVLLAENSDVDKILAIAKELVVYDAITKVLSVCRSIMQEFKVQLRLFTLIQKVDPPLISVTKMPYKFPFITVCKALLRKISDDHHSKKFLLKAILAGLSRKHISDFLTHLSRETY